MPQNTKDTPMMQQYLAIKADYPDAFLFYRIGDFYELFYEDATRGAQLLELTLTARNKNAQDPIPMCGVPHHAAAAYIDTLVEQGYKVAICEQVEDPKTAVGMVKREVIQLITPGTALDLRDRHQTDNSFLAAIQLDTIGWGLALADLATGEIKVTTVRQSHRLIDELLAGNVREVVVTTDLPLELTERLQQAHIMISTVEQVDSSSEYHFVAQPVVEKLQRHALKILISYLLTTQKRHLAHLQPAQVYQLTQFLQLDYAAELTLELFKTNRSGKRQGTLAYYLDQTKTAMGSRLLKQWLHQPLLAPDRIKQRQQVVQAFLTQVVEREQFQQALAGVYDLERLAGKLALGSANGRDLNQLAQSLGRVPQLVHVLQNLSEPSIQEDLKQLDLLQTLKQQIEQTLVENPPISVMEGHLIRSGVDPTLDDYRDAMHNGKQWMAELEAHERQLTGINTLKVGFNKVFGYYIEVTKANLANLPVDRYERKQTLTNAERFVTPELKVKETLILEAEEKSTALEYQVFDQLRQQAKRHTGSLQKLAHVIAKYDVLQGFSELSEQQRLVQPQLNTVDQTIRISKGRHPVVEQVLPTGTFIPNDLTMSSDCEVLLITGPNMSGKSTFMRQLALIVIMNQIGCFVPAAKAKLPIFDRIFTRIGAADDLIAGESTFMVEMKEANLALQEATAQSLILFDELGRGTSTYDGIALADAIVSYLHQHVHAKTLFSTHYHELTTLEQHLKRVKNIHVGAKEVQGTLVFLHQVLPGAADRSYGIHVAQLAGLPTEVTQHANQILQRLEAKTATTKVSENLYEEVPLFVWEEQPVASPTPSSESPAKPAPLTTPETDVLNQVTTQDLSRLTPLAALNKLAEWQDQLRSQGKGE